MVPDIEQNAMRAGLCCEGNRTDSLTDEMDGGHWFFHFSNQVLNLFKKPETFLSCEMHHTFVLAHWLTPYCYTQ